MKKNRPLAIVKKIFKVFVIFLALLIGFAFAAPFLFRGKIIALVKKEINNNIHATADFTNVDISFLRSFPRVSVSIEDLRITGSDEFSRDTLIAAKEINVALNIKSVIQGSDFKIYSIEIDQECQEDNKDLKDLFNDR